MYFRIIPEKSAVAIDRQKSCSMRLYQDKHSYLHFSPILYELPEPDIASKKGKKGGQCADEGCDQDLKNIAARAGVQVGEGIL